MYCLEKTGRRSPHSSRYSSRYSILREIPQPNNPLPEEPQDPELEYLDYSQDFEELWEIPFSAVRDYLKNYAREHYFVESY